MHKLTLWLLKLVAAPLARYAERHFVLYLDLGGDAPPPPDYTPVADASREAAEIAARLGRDQLDEARRQYEQNMSIARPVVDAQLDIMRQTTEQGRDYYEYGKTFRPLEQQMLSQAAGGLTARDIVRMGIKGISPADALRQVSNFVPARGSVGGAGAMNTAWDAYWQAIEPGKSMDFAGGKLARNDDGSATYTSPTGRTYTYDRETPFSEVARMNPEIAKEWQKTFAYKKAGQTGGTTGGTAPAPAPMPPHAPPSPGYTPPASGGAPAAPPVVEAPIDGEFAAATPLLRFASAADRRQPGARFAQSGINIWG